MAKLLYLDYNCFQRGYDDPSQIRIVLEAAACREIFLQALRRDVAIVWSFMHKDETTACKIVKRREEALNLAGLCEIFVKPTEDILRIGLRYSNAARIDPKDALHLACASIGSRVAKETRQRKMPSSRGFFAVAFNTREPIKRARHTLSRVTTNY